MPCFQAFSAAAASGSAWYGCTESVPKDRLTTRMRVPSAVVGCWVTQSSAAMTWLTSVLPSVVASFSASSEASGATPSCDGRG